MFIRKTLCSLTLFTGLFAGIQSAQASLLDIAQSPLQFSKSVPPNLILTVDDSASMNYGFAPDSIGFSTPPDPEGGDDGGDNGGGDDGGDNGDGDGEEQLSPTQWCQQRAEGTDFQGNQRQAYVNGCLATANQNTTNCQEYGDQQEEQSEGTGVPAFQGCSVGRGYGTGSSGPDGQQAKSSAYNAVYFNPDVQYQVPAGFAAPTFDNAWNNGFDQDQGSVNLNNAYRVLWDVPTTQEPPADDIDQDTGDNAAYTEEAPEHTFEAGTSSEGKVVYKLAKNPAQEFSGVAAGIPKWVQDLLNIALQASGAGGSIDLSSIPAVWHDWSSESGIWILVQKPEDDSGGGDDEDSAPKPCRAYALVNNQVLGLTDANAVQCTPDPDDDNQFFVSLSERKVPAYYYTGLGDEVQLHWVGGEGTDEQKQAEKQNFANWYSFYRNRALADQTAAHIVIPQLPSSLQVTWQSLTQATGGDTPSDFTAQRQDDFLKWLRARPYEQDSSPLQDAVTNAEKIANVNPYSDGTNTYTCQANYHLAFTDGIWNGGSGNLLDQVKEPNTAAGDVPPYLPYGERTYDDANQGTPSVSADDPRNDPSTSFHLVNFFVAPGTLSAALTNPLWNDDLGTYGNQAFRDGLGNVQWPDSSADDDNKLYDLWQAAIKSRGELISANNQNGGALERLRQRLGEWITATTKPEVVYSQSGAGSSQSEDAVGAGQGSYYDVYENRADVTAWSGDLLKNRYVEDNGQTQLASGYPKSAAEELGQVSYNNRKILIGNLSNASATNYSPLPFSYNTFTRTFGFTPGASDSRWEALNLDRDADSATLARDQLAQQRIQYIAGDRSQEEGSGDGKFRKRGKGDRTGQNEGTKDKPNTVKAESVLGDIINSSPVWVGKEPQQKGDLPTIYGESYKSFASNINGRDPMVYVGANDGMLHAFDADDLGEKWAFIPKAVIPNLYKLAGHSYQAAHQNYVDGTVTVADAKIGGQWKTVLIGTLGGGGREIFALDITNPEPGQIKVLWEKTNADAGYENLGYTFSKPQVALLPGDNEGAWSVVVGNGYGNVDPNHPDGTSSDSQTDKTASLLVINLADGKVRGERIVTGDHVNPNQANGLSTPVLTDFDYDGRSDFAYAGDLQGNLWRFSLHQQWSSLGTQVRQTVGDLTGDNSSGRLFSIRDVNLGNDDQGNPIYPPITAQPSVTAHPSRAGYLVAFGSGKYFEQKDVLPYHKSGNDNPYYAYGVWDKHTQLADFKKKPTVVDDDRNLVEQTFVDPPTGAQSNRFRSISQNAVDWDQNTGWKIELKPSEMVISPVQVNGDMLTFSTFTPKDPCAPSYDSDDRDYSSKDNEQPGVWTYGVNASSGSQTKKAWIQNIQGTDATLPSTGGEGIAGMNVGSLAPPTISGDKLFFGGKGDSGSATAGAPEANVNPEAAEGACGGTSSGWCSWQILKEDGDE